MKPTPPLRLLTAVLWMLLLGGLSVPVVAATEEGEKTEKKKADGQQASTAKAPAPAPVSPYIAAMESARARRAQGSAKVITNEELARLTSPEASAPAPAAAETAGEQPRPAAAPVPGVSPLEYMKAQEDKRLERQRERSAAEQELKAARQRVTDLEKRLKGFRSPFKPYPGKPENDEAWDTQNTAERIAATEEQLAAARKALRAAEQRAAAVGAGR